MVMPLAYPYLYVDEIPTGREGTVFQTSFEREYTRNFRVIVALKEMGPLDVAQCPYLPRPYSFYISQTGVEYDLSALCVNISAKQDVDDDWSMWVASCKYSTIMPKGGPVDDNSKGLGSPQHKKGASNNPEDEPPDIDWDFETSHKTLPYDLDGKPYLNSAGMPYATNPPIDQGYPILVYTRNELFFNKNNAAKFAYAVNSDNFLGNPPGTVQCLPPKAKMRFKGLTAYFRVTYRFRFLVPNEDGRYVPESWQPEILDAGFYQLPKFVGPPDPNAPDPTPVPCLDAWKQKVGHAVCLDGNGYQLLPTKAIPGGLFGGMQLADKKVMKPVYNKYRNYRKVKFKDIIDKGTAAGRL